ncbi:hypothetical protein [Streptomyces sp. AK02-01A]|uniref:hypothetical protein n=1 Tax=Streptomyces sp. AK02-01A TaxID=3028648 RepID=UPI0029A30C19|nr:hypothetical protein [Streptomyces sp. AK02-01A]MDX3850294.1 hypothetical protein [Streptomyces sp. AK02-01A]
MSGVYEANPGGLRRSIDGMKRLPEMAKSLGEDFRRAENTYTEWPGWTDDFARQVRPKYNDNNEYCLRIGTALFGALDALVSATLANLENIEGTQSDATEQIRDHQQKTDTVLSGVDGRGKH